MPGALVAGVDIGTSSVKVVVINRETKETLGSCCLKTDAGVPSTQPGIGGASEQDPGRIISAVQSCLLRIPEELRAQIGWIGVSGQMHGVVLWKSGHGWKRDDQSGMFSSGDCVSRLYTWMDGRCGRDFLSDLPKPDSHLRLATGFGCSTLFWLKRHAAHCLDDYDCAGTIQDYLISMLCALDKPVMSTQNAASWGYFNTEDSKWNKEILSSSDFPVYLLPEVKQPGSVAGCTQYKWCVVPEAAIVTVAMGDLQCSILARIFATDVKAVVNISTSAQVCLLMPGDFVPVIPSPESNFQNEETVEYFPYFNGQYLAVAASLNGGNVLAAFVEMLQIWTADLGADVSTEEIWSRLCSDAAEDGPIESNALIVEPTIFGERHKPNSLGIVRNISPSNVSLHSVYRSLCRGIAQNLCAMMPPQKLKAANATRMFGSGSVLTSNLYLRSQLEQFYQLTIEVEGEYGCDAAFGAALVAAGDHLL